MSKINLEGITAVFFDLDGTLVDSVSVVEEIYTKIMLQHGAKFNAPYQQVWEQFTEQYNPTETPIFVAWAEFIMNKFNIVGVFASEISDSARKQIQTAYTTMGYKAGASDVLHELKKRGMQLVMVTSASDNHVQVLVENKTINDAAPILDVFSHAVTSNMTTMRKPHPDPYNMALKLAGVKPEQVLVFEDSLEGVRSARAAGIENVVIIHDPSSADNLGKMKQMAKLDFKTWKEVLKAL